MTDTTMQLLSQGTDPVKMPDFDILAEGKRCQAWQSA